LVSRGNGTLEASHSGQLGFDRPAGEIRLGAGEFGQGCQDESRGN
jgi:hypothetical protein